jgi:uncharacterized protein YndB with AHSA1/START domain
MADLIAKASITIDAPSAKVWEALINPELIKQYLFGTEAKSDWQAGSSITYTGSWQGKTYEDKGMVLRVEPEKLLETTYWSSMSGEADSPENYKKVTYQLTTDNDQTTLTISNNHNKTEQDMIESQNNWTTVLEGIKKLLEK